MWRVFRSVPVTRVTFRPGSRLHSGGGSGRRRAGVSAERPDSNTPAQLVRMDGRDGRVIGSRPLDRDSWRIAIAPFRTLPPGEARLDTFTRADRGR